MRPTGVWPYFDKVQAWLREPADMATIAELRRRCGRGGLYADHRSARFDGAYRQRIELRQPSPAALQWLASRQDALINRAEIALDFIFQSIAERDDGFEFLHRHIVRRWHGKRQKIKLVRGQKSEPNRKSKPDVVDEVERGQTRYDASRTAPNGTVFYRTKFSRITGELNCLHLEWRANGLRAVRKLGIETGQDLLKFDHHAFWRKRLLLHSVEPDRLGRLVRNRTTGKKSRTSNYLDGRMGHVLINSVGSIQELIDQYGTRGRLSRVLRVIPNEGLLPGQ